MADEQVLQLRNMKWSTQFLSAVEMFWTEWVRVLFMRGSRPHITLSFSKFVFCWAIIGGFSWFVSSSDFLSIWKDQEKQNDQGRGNLCSFSLVLCSLGQSFALAFRGKSPAKEKETSKEPYQSSKNKAILLLLFLIYGRIFTGKTDLYPICEL